MDTVKQIKYEAAISEKNDANTNQSLKMRSVSRTQKNSHTNGVMSQLKVDASSGSSLRKKSLKAELLDEAEKLDRQLENVQVKNLDSLQPVTPTVETEQQQAPPKKKKKTIVRKMRHIMNERVGAQLFSAGRSQPNPTIQDPLTIYEMKAMFKVTWDGMRKNHFQHMHSKQEEEQAQSRLVDYKKRIGLTREMNSLLNKQATEV